MAQSDRFCPTLAKKWKIKILDFCWTTHARWTKISVQLDHVPWGESFTSETVAKISAANNQEHSENRFAVKVDISENLEVVSIVMFCGWPQGSSFTWIAPILNERGTSVVILPILIFHHSIDLEKWLCYFLTK